MSHRERLVPAPNGTSTRILLFFTLLFAGMFISCSDSRPPETAVASIGSSEISVPELVEFAQRIPDGFHWDKSDSQAVASVLEALIDKRILLMEATTRGIEEMPSVAAQIEGYREQEILNAYNRLKINQTIQITDQEIEQHYRATKRDKALRPGVIVLSSMDKALEVIDELNAGADFAEMASTHSAEELTRSVGGDMGRYIRWDAADMYTRPLFELQVNELSEPIPVMHKKKRHYAVFRVIDEMEVPLKEVESDVEQELFGQKRSDRAVALTDSLWTALHGVVLADGAGFIAERADRDGSGIELSSPESLELQLARYDGGELTIGSFIKSVIDSKEEHKKRQLADSAWVSSSARGMILGEILIAEARALGLGENPELIARVRNFADEAAISTMRKIEIDDHIKASKEESRAYFDANPGQFLYSATTTLWEILLPDEETAKAVVGRLEGGENPENLIAEYYTRAVHEEVRGQIHLDRYSAAHYSGLLDYARDVAVGEIGGPLKVPEGYSVFKIISQEPARPKPFGAASQKRAGAYVQLEKAKRGYVTYVKELRKKYEVEIYASNVPPLIKDSKLDTALVTALSN